MKPSKKCIAINTCWLLVLLFLGATAHAAAVVGTVADLSGLLIAKKVNGVMKVLAQKSEVEQGDILFSEKDTYARLRFIDNSEITLQPNSQLEVANFSFDAAKPKGDSAVFNLIKGGLRSISGLIGKRSAESVNFKTPAATIGIRGTTFIAQYTPMPGAASPPPPGAANRAPGLYVQVLDGVINLSNRGGSQNFSAGQFGYTPNFTQPPVIVPVNPGIRFAPPPAFASSIGRQNRGDDPGAADSVDCEVR